tara:strand:- start:1027 stop:1449 length:423 start_codon:yes stop_codon:yes gene_type:complete
MKVTIIKPDGFVSCDGKGVHGLSLSGISDDVWAVHWDTVTKEGELEKTDLSITAITDFTPYASAITEYGEKVEADPTEISSLAAFRKARNDSLTATDWTQLPDAPLSAEKVAEYKTYRQTLRDLPANTTDYDINKIPLTP